MGELQQYHAGTSVNSSVRMTSSLSLLRFREILKEVIVDGEKEEEGRLERKIQAEGWLLPSIDV